MATGLNISGAGKSYSEEIAKAIGVIKSAEKTSKTDTPVSDVLLSQLKYSRDVKSTLTQSQNEMQMKLDRLTEKLEQVTLALQTGEKDLDDPLPTVPVADHSLGFKPVQMGPKFGLVFVYFSNR